MGAEVPGLIAEAALQLRQAHGQLVERRTQRVTAKLDLLPLIRIAS
jgi:hypothetical protein